MFMGFFLAFCGIIFYFLAKPYQPKSKNNTVPNIITSNFVTKDASMTSEAKSNA